MGQLCIAMVTSYRLAIVTIGLSLTVFAVLQLVQTDRQTDNGQIDGIGPAKMCISGQKSNMSMYTSYNKQNVSHNATDFHLNMLLHIRIDVRSAFKILIQLFQLQANLPAN